MSSFADRGIALEPQPTRYRSGDEAHLDGRDRVLEQNADVQRTARRNGERIIADPEIVLEVLESKPVVGGALAGKAAEGLSDPEAPGIPARTLHAWQWAWDHGRDLLTDKHVLVIDEAGMVGTKQLETKLATARAAGAKVVVVGDTRQLQAIVPGAPMRRLQEQHGAVKLTNIIRQKIDWQKQSTKLFGDGEEQRG